MQTFDAMDRLTRRSTSGPGVSHPAVESWEFDVRSRLVRRIDPAGRSWRARYDALDRAIEVDDGAGRVTTYTYDRNSNVLDQVSTDASTGLKTHTDYVRDARGRVLEVIAPQGMSRTYSYGSNDRPGTIGLPGDRRVERGLGRPWTADHGGLHRSGRLGRDRHPAGVDRQFTAGGPYGSQRQHHALSP